MASLILFRFHAEFGLCAERLKLLRTLNPETPIHCMYGGPPSESATAAKALASLVEGIYAVPASNAHWKKMHQDLTLARWFTDVRSVDCTTSRQFAPVGFGRAWERFRGASTAI